MRKMDGSCFVPGDGKRHGKGIRRSISPPDPFSMSLARIKRGGHHHRQRPPQIFKLATGIEPVTSSLPMRCATYCAMPANCLSQRCHRCQRVIYYYIFLHLSTTFFLFFIVGMLPDSCRYYEGFLRRYSESLQKFSIQ